MNSPIEEALATKRREGAVAGHACPREDAHDPGIKEWRQPAPLSGMDAGHTLRLRRIIRATEDARQLGPGGENGPPPRF